MHLQLIAEREHGDGGRHLRLHAEGHLEHELLALLDRTGLEHELLVLVRAGREVPKGRDGVALDLFVVDRPQQVDQRLQEARLDDGRLVERVDGDVADAGDGGQDQRQVGRLQQPEQRRQPARLDDLELVFLVRREVSERQCGLTLHLRRRGAHEGDERLDQASLGLSQALAVRRVDGDVAQRRRAVVLYVDVRRREKLDEHRHRAGVDQLLSVVV